MIQDVRQRETVTLHANILKIDDASAEQVIDFLNQEYTQETLEYSGDAPPFDREAAIWAAKTIYVVAQLILYREHKEAVLASLLPDFKQDITPAAILSADLCLRFLPEMIKQLKAFDTEDAIIPLLDDIMVVWHYSGVDHSPDISLLNFNTIQRDRCLLQMYTERIIQYKNIQLAKHTLFYPLIAAQLGGLSDELWSDFKKITVSDEHS
ncbi:hypothetical protein GCM10022393_36580 [Aquimarina addita]|uniref:MoxR-vWA-beta-propeller ternary system domain-containing protein n=2 Tax=Aquimarina addita TaxID=870485 RepID=A0ABP6URY5_9FLAO